MPACVHILLHTFCCPAAPAGRLGMYARQGAALQYADIFIIQQFAADKLLRSASSGSVTDSQQARLAKPHAERHRAYRDRSTKREGRKGDAKKGGGGGKYTWSGPRRIDAEEASPGLSKDPRDPNYDSEEDCCYVRTQNSTQISLYKQAVSA